MANIYDVAKEAGVSIATVSAVINESAYVSPKLLRRVQEAIERLGYQPNLLARGLAKRQSHTLGVVVPDISNPFFPDVIRGAEDEAQRAGYSLLVVSSDNDPGKERSYLEILLAKQVDGLLLTKAPGRLPDSFQARIRKAGAPVLQLIRTIAGFKSDAVIPDDRGAAYEGVAHLLRLGYSRIGLITGVRGVSTTRRRVAGYREALRDWGVRFEPNLVAAGDYRVESGYLAGLDLLKRRPQAVFVSNYLMTVGLMRAMAQYQVKCPEDLAIVTCDNYDWLDTFSPRLTTIDFPKYELGAEAVRLLLARLRNSSRPPETVMLKNSMCIRESCGHLLRADRPGIPKSPSKKAEKLRRSAS